MALIDSYLNASSSGSDTSGTGRRGLAGRSASQGQAQCFSPVSSPALLPSSCHNVPLASRGKLSLPLHGGERWHLDGLDGVHGLEHCLLPHIRVRLYCGEQLVPLDHLQGQLCITILQLKVDSQQDGFRGHLLRMDHRCRLMQTLSGLVVLAPQAVGTAQVEEHHSPGRVHRTGVALRGALAS